MLGKWGLGAMGLGVTGPGSMGLGVIPKHRVPKCGLLLNHLVSVPDAVHTHGA